MKEFIEKLIAGQDLGDQEMETAFDAIMSGQANDIQIGRASCRERVFAVV